jgi:hypothetical protein
MASNNNRRHVDRERRRPHGERRRHRDVMSGALPIPNNEEEENKPPQIRYSAAQGRPVDASRPPMRYSAAQGKFVPISEPPWQPELYRSDSFSESPGIVLKPEEPNQSSSTRPHSRKGKEKVQTWIPQSDTATSQSEPSLPPLPLSEMSYDSSATFQRRRTAEVPRYRKERMLPTTTTLPVRTVM